MTVYTDTVDHWSMLLLLAFTAIQLQPAAPVAITRTEITGTQSSPTILVEIENRTNLAVTAWKLAFLLHRSNGETLRVGSATDGYLSYAGVVPDRDVPIVIQPYARTTWTETVDVQPPGVIGVDVTLEYAVFADGTWSGDASGVEDCFRARQAEHAATTEILAVLKNARDTAQGAEAVRRALQQLEQDAGNGRKERVRQNLRGALRTGGPPLDTVLRQQIASYELRLHAVNEHRRKGAQRRG